MKLLKAPDPGSKQYVLLRLKMPKWFNVYFHGDETEPTYDVGPEEDREMIVFIREKPQTDQPKHL